MSGTITLVAPFAGWLGPIEDVPDPVFAERMMGDGLAIDPTEGVLRAPMNGTVVSVAPTGHAVTIRHASGAELLLHLGLETVALGGRGFHPQVSAGATVRAGEPLIAFDLDEVARAARSMVTPIVLASEGQRLEVGRTGRAVAAGEPVATITGAGAISAPTEAAGTVATREVHVTAAHGIHARPAARIARVAKEQDAELRLVLGEANANARSTVALLGLGVRHGDRVRVEARGQDAETAANALAALIADGFGEADEAPAVEAPPIPTQGPVTAAPGLAIGTAFQLRAADRAVPREGSGASAEAAALARALGQVEAELAGTGGAAAAIADAHRELLSDPELLARAHCAIAEGRSAAFAWRAASEDARALLRATGDARLAERAADLLDLERRVIAVLAGEETAAPPQLPADAIVLAEDLLPSQFLLLDTARLAGIATAAGGPTSHVAILAAAAGVPMVVAAGPAILAVADRETVILDADAPAITASPDPAALAYARARIAERTSAHTEAKAASAGPCRMADGTRIEVFANLGSAADAHAAVAAGAEGCGLLRTEFLFLDRAAAPSEAEQRAIYAEVAAALRDRPVIVRTLDIGGDKPVPYLPMPREENPALGQRGIRLSLARPEMLATQLRAIMAAVPGDRCWIMAPMVIDLAELRAFRAAAVEAALAIGRTEPVRIGVMIETAAAALLADGLAAEADFFSIGTNDLTQYALACDRGNAAVSAKLDALHPAVLRLIAAAADGARRHDRPLGVCGGLAADPLAAPILIGLGVTELSMPPAAIPAAKAAIRRLDLARCRDLGARALAAESAAAVRAIAREIA